MIFNFPESSCYSSVEVNEQEVKISFQSNPEKVYTFFTDDAETVVEYLQNPVGSVGQNHHRWIAEQILIPAEQLAAV